jgi:hypothetical protein
MNRRAAVLVTLVWLAAILGLALLNAAVAPARASEQTASPVERPRQQNSADWTVQTDAFESNYPAGFTFRLQASSSAGEITRARAIWHRPTLRPGETLTIYAEDAALDPDSGEWVANWAPGNLQMLPPWSLLEYHWELKDEAGNEFESEPVEVEYADATRAWTRSESADAVVFTSDLEGRIEEMVLDALAQQHDQYVAVWGDTLPYKPRIVLFGNFDAWLEWRSADHETSDTSFVIGQTFDEWGVIAQVLYGSDEPAYLELAYSTVPHETEHLYQAEFLAPRKMYDVPAWFFEGDATFFEVEQSYDYLGRVRDEFAATDLLPPLLTVNPADAPRTDGETPRDGYDIGYSFFAWLEEYSGGLEAHAELMSLLAANMPFFDALEQVTGLTTQEIEREWRVWLGASPEPPALIPTWTPFFPVVATPAAG